MLSKPSGISQWWSLSDLNYLLKKCPNISYLNIAEAYGVRINESFYDFLMQNCLKLKRLVLSSTAYYPTKIQQMKQHFEGIQIDL